MSFRSTEQEATHKELQAELERLNGIDITTLSADERARHYDKISKTSWRLSCNRRPKSIQPAGNYTLARVDNAEAPIDEQTLSNLSLEALAVFANEAAEEATKAANKAVEYAIRCGRALIAAKSQVEHGGWLPWLRTNFDRSPDTAGLWMKLAANSERVRNLEEAPSIRAALRLIDLDAEMLSDPSCEVDEPEADNEVAGSEGETESVVTIRPARQNRSVVVGEENADADDNEATPTQAPEVFDLRGMAEQLTNDYRILLAHSPKHANAALMKIVRAALQNGLPIEVQAKIRDVIKHHKPTLPQK
jgi:hypothetical protein